MSLRSAYLSGGRSPGPTANSPRQEMQPLSPKKTQSMLKVNVQSFGKQILSWKHNVGEIQRLLDKIFENINIKASIEKTIFSVSANKLFTTFPDARDRVLGNLINECEQLFTQVKFFVRSIQDTLLAMRFIAEGAYGDIENTSCDLWEVGVFTVEHVLDIQQLYSQFSQEWYRKSVLLDCLCLRRKDKDYSNSTSLANELLCNREAVTLWMDAPAISEAILLWGDDNPASLLNNEKGMIS